MQHGNYVTVNTAGASNLSQGSCEIPGESTCPVTLWFLPLRFRNRGVLPGKRRGGGVSQAGLAGLLKSRGSEPTRHPHERAQGGPRGCSREEAQGHLISGNAVRVFADDDVRHSRGCKEGREEKPIRAAKPKRTQRGLNWKFTNGPKTGNRFSSTYDPH